MPGGSWSHRSGSRPRPIVADERPRAPQPGWTEVILVAFAVVVAVLAAAAVTGFLPTPIQQAIFHGPVLIVVLIVGTGWLLWRISRGRPVDDER